MRYFSIFVCAIAVFVGPYVLADTDMSSALRALDNCLTIDHDESWSEQEEIDARSSVFVECEEERNYLVDLFPQGERNAVRKGLLDSLERSVEAVSARWRYRNRYKE